MRAVSGADPDARPGSGPDPDVRAAVRTAVSVSLATGLYGVSFGALSVAAGLDLPQTMVLGLLMFSGGSQFAVVGVLGAGGGVGAAVATAGLLGARNGLYGVQVAPLLEVRGWRRLLAAHLTIDESTAVATAQPGPASTRAGFWWTGAGVFVLWNAFTLLGALLGDALGDPRRYGLDAAAGAAFLALLWPRLSGPGTRTVRVVAVAAALTALALTPVVPAGVPVLAAAALAVVVGVLGDPDGEAPDGEARGGGGPDAGSGDRSVRSGRRGPSGGDPGVSSSGPDAGNAGPGDETPGPGAGTRGPEAATLRPGASTGGPVVQP